MREKAERDRDEGVTKDLRTYSGEPIKDPFSERCCAVWCTPQARSFATFELLRRRGLDPLPREKQSTEVYYERMLITFYLRAENSFLPKRI